MLPIIPKFRLQKAGNSCNSVFDPGGGPEMAKKYDDKAITLKGKGNQISSKMAYCTW